MRRGEPEEDECEECGEAAIEHRRPNGGEGSHCPLTAGSRRYEEGVTNVDRVVHTETHSQYDVDTGDNVDGDVPEMQEANDVHEGEDYSEEYHH